jgi:DNA repair exonuclease SbcCD nuclease subunit
MMRILLLADTHLGFDYAFRPRIVRRRRGPDFFHNFWKALEPAFREEVDIVVHGGDILYRSRVPARLVDMAFEPLRAVADRGVSVYVVPGNHERSGIPFRILAAHPNIHVFDEPRTYWLERGFRLALVGFPFVRHGIRKKFRQVMESTGYRKAQAAGYVLCMHQSVDGCIMGPRDFMMRGGDDVVDIHEIPPSFCCVLTGHMHRSQVLEQDPAGNTVRVPILYPGSIERTSFAEKDEIKGYIIIEIHYDASRKARLSRYIFHELPTRPMIRLEYNCVAQGSFAPWLQHRLSRLPKDSIVKIRVRGTVDRQLQKTITASSLRSLAPDTMNIQIALDMHRKDS